MSAAVCRVVGLDQETPPKLMLDANVPLIDLGIPHAEAGVIKVGQTILGQRSILPFLRHTESIGERIGHTSVLRESTVQGGVEWCLVIPVLSAILPVGGKVQAIVKSSASANNCFVIEGVGK